MQFLGESCPMILLSMIL
uniref:Bm7056, isoform c n=1 Tax=Brugia malayi TaxID=6279 RepID=A0A0J9XP49_BRUMA|nr:Bm7056, isoform c [Brugia malayi]